MISPNGFDNLQWFIGIVEDNQDPTNQGRVRVRCFGIHPSFSSELVPTEHLPWAVPINGTYGKLSQIPRKADWVFGFFIDGRDAQHPMLLGTIPGQNLQQMSGSGEISESSYTAPSEESMQNYGHQPLHPSMSGEDKHSTAVPLQNSLSRDGVKIPQEDRGWDEPPVPLSGEPHKSAVLSSRYGETYIEVNGSDNSEHIIISHESGSHILIDKSGNIKLKSIGGDSYYMSEGHSREYVGGRKDVTIEGNWTINVTNGNAILEIQGDMEHIVHGNYNLNVAGRMTTSIGLGYEISCARYTLETVAEHINLISAEKIKMLAKDTFSMESEDNFYITSQKKFYTRAFEDIMIGSDEEIDIYAASRLNLTGNPVTICGTVTIPESLKVNNLNPDRITPALPGFGVSVTAHCAIQAPRTPETTVPPQVPPPVDQIIGLPDNEVKPATPSITSNSLDDNEGPQ